MADIELMNQYTPMTLAEILADFAYLDDWEDKYRYVIDLGRGLDPLPASAHSEANKVRGCASQVWLQVAIEHSDGQPILNFLADSDAHIVKGLIYILLTIYSGKRASDILAIDAQAVFKTLGLDEHLTPQRANGVRAMVERIQREARAALAAV